MFGFWGFSSFAYPPGPYHLLYGTVRDQYGTPLNLATSRVLLQTPSGQQYVGPISFTDTSVPGVNYELKVPLDAGSTPDLYQPGVLLPAASYKLLVVVGTVTNVPIEMGSNYFSLGQWTKNARVDLTLGVDSNGDGLPDAWEYAFMMMIGTNLPLSSINGNTVLTPDGTTLWQNFILGTTLFDPGNPFRVVFVGFNGSSPILEFPTISGRSYTVYVSSDLHTWSPVGFKLPTDSLGAATRSFYFASSTAPVQVYVAPPPLGTPKQFYRIQVQ